MNRPIPIQIVSDVVCPWCYVGKRRLDKALAERPGLEVEITWLPFQLSPDMPREGRDRHEHYASIFGEERARQITARMKQTGASEGIAFDAPPGARSPNTLSAHVLLYWASRDPDVDQSALAEKLFEAHHVRGQDVGDHRVLARLGAEVGLDEAQTLEKLRLGSDEEEVRALIGQAQEAGISGVPFFIIDEVHGLSGAQPVETLVAVLDEVSGAPARVTDAELGGDAHERDQAADGAR